MLITPIKTRVFKEKENLSSFITEEIANVPDNAILVVTSKIVALSEGRTVTAASPAEKERLIRETSKRVWPTKYVTLTLTKGMLMANAGIDESNAHGKLILLPSDSYATAHQLRTDLCSRYNITNLGILITDSRTTPLRAGVTGAALGYAGFRGVRDYRGTNDLFGRPFVFSQTNVADSLATAATLVMGEGDECQPLALIADAPVEFCETVNTDETVINPEDDMYAPLLLPTTA